MDVILQKFNKLFDIDQHPELWHLIHPDKSDTVFHVALKGEALLSSSKWNKGLAFTSEERKAFKLEGRLPHTVATLDQQCQRAYLQVGASIDVDVYWRRFTLQ
ncbi:NAD-dependent malic enzyme, mitochondrial [Ceratobasidium sp. 428]|nr:NAD-dependent malic enzyme, mitochondrial [Ceratobasidium sp. 428]